MNKKGNVFLGVAFGLIIWIFGVLFIPYLADDITTFRTAMDCSNTEISGATMINCLFGDLVMPYFIWTMLSALLGYIAGRNT